MSYVALYRKYRPAVFDDVRGQDHIVTTLRNQIRAGRIGHAYLFSGTRGTGKTTVAKIFAKAINCEEPQNGSPCCACQTCRAIAAGASMDVVEIDAASNNGVDNIRRIKEEVSYPPTEGKYKVYIIDEVHMLSPGAYNALLKTLEEPPAYVVFILATTEANRLPATILSRCQRYDFHRIGADTIAARMMELLAAEGQEAEEKAVRYIAKAADGSMRDALSLLDQSIAFFLGEKLTYENTLNILGAVDTEIFHRLLAAVRTDDVAAAAMLVEELVMQGRELGQFVTDFLWYLRSLMLIKASPQAEKLLDMTQTDIAKLKEEAAAFDEETILHYIRIFSELSDEMKFATQKRVLLEVAVIKLCRPSMDADTGALGDRLASLERRVEKGIAAQPKAAARKAPAQMPPKKEEKELPKALPEDIAEVVQNWDRILRGLPPRLRPDLSRARVTYSEKKITLVLNDRDNPTIPKKNDHAEDPLPVIMRQIEKTIGKHVDVDIQWRETEDADRNTFTFRDLKQAINAEIEIEDEEDGL